MPYLRMELNATRVVADAKRLAHRPACELDGGGGHREPVALRVHRLEAPRQDAQDGVVDARRRQLGLVEARERSGSDAVDEGSEGVRERLRTQAHAEQRRALGDPAAERLVLLVQPRVLDLLAHVLLAAENEHGVVALSRRSALRADVPRQQVMPFAGDHVTEELGLDERPMRDREHDHAAGTSCSSSSRRNSCAPAVACGTPWVWLLLLKNAYASSA